MEAGSLIATSSSSMSSTNQISRSDSKSQEKTVKKLNRLLNTVMNLSTFSKGGMNSRHCLKSITLCSLLLLLLDRSPPIKCKSLLEFSATNGELRHFSPNPRGADKWIPIRDYSTSPIVEVDKRAPVKAEKANQDQLKTSESQLKPTTNSKPPTLGGQSQELLQAVSSNSGGLARIDCIGSGESKQQLLPVSLNLEASSSGMSSVVSGARPQMRRSAPDGGQQAEEESGDSDNDDEDDEELEGKTLERQQMKLRREMLNGNESVSLESAVAPPRGGYKSRLLEMANQNEMEEPNGERSEQEAAEASEAEAADRSALDEQQQQQREIILAQAQSEAKAIKEQQESLLRQQRLQQQMLLRRHQELEANQSDARLIDSPPERRQLANWPQLQRQQSRANRLRSNAQPSDQYGQQQTQLQEQTGYENGLTNQEYGESRQEDQSDSGGQQMERPPLERVRLEQSQSSQYERRPTVRRPAQVDIQFSDTDQPDSKTYNSMRGADERDDVMGDNSVRKALISEQAPELELSRKSAIQGDDDLLVAAQHHYGTHYDSLHGHQKDHYQ